MKHRLGGYDLYFLRLRVANLSKKPSTIMDSSIVGVEIVMNFLDNSAIYEDTQIPGNNSRLKLYNALHPIYITGPYGVRLGKAQKEEFGKLPDGIDEKVFTEEGGAYASQNVGNMHMKAISGPVRKEKIVESMTVTVIDPFANNK